MNNKELLNEYEYYNSDDYPENYKDDNLYEILQCNGIIKPECELLDQNTINQYLKRAIAINIINFNDIKKEYLSKELIMLDAMTNFETYNREYLECTVPEKFRDYDLYNFLVKYCAYPLEEVPEEFIDYNMCLIAVSVFARNEKYSSGFPYIYPLQSVPDKYKDDKIVSAFLKSIIDMEHWVEFDWKNGFEHRLTKLIPDKLLTEEYVKQILKNNALEFRLIPDRYKTKEIIKYWVDVIYSDPEIIYDYYCLIDIIPEEYLTYDFCLNAVKAFEELIKYVPSKWKDEIEKATINK